MLTSIIAFIVMLNPFALFLYMQPIMKELDDKTFLKVLAKASFISLALYSIFVFFGDFIFRYMFQIEFDSFRIFGGVIIFSYAYFFIVKGDRAMIKLKGDLDDLASEIALPFMVGAGTISLIIVSLNQFQFYMSFLMVAAALLFNFIFIIILKIVREQIERKHMRIAFDKNMEILLRLNGFFVGAIGVNMIINGIRGAFFG